MLRSDLCDAMATIFNARDVQTQLDLAMFNPEWINEPTHRRLSTLDSIKTKFYAECANNFVMAASIEPGEMISTSLDNILGGPIVKGEVTSIEGASGTGKTRMCVKIAHDFTAFGNVLYIDSDFSLQPNIFVEIQKSLDLDEPVVPFYGEFVNENPDEVPKFCIMNCTNTGELYSAINRYSEHSKPDLVVIDSVFSLLHNFVTKDGPGSAMLEEFALELKWYAQTHDCAVVITNALKTDSSPPTPFLGKQYASMWHQRLMLSTRNYFATTCELVASQRYQYQKVIIKIETLKECGEDDIISLDQD